MKPLKITGLSILGMACLFFAVGLALPDPSRVERSIVISADVDIIFDLVNDLVKNEAWSSRTMDDPGMEITYGPVTEGPGASCVWRGEISGEGKLTQRESVPFSSIKRVLDSGERGATLEEWKFEPHEAGVKVTERWESKAANLLRRFANQVNKEMVCAHLDNDLVKLKEISEGITRAPEN